MNRLVREHYPVSKLPEDLREGFRPDDQVRVTVDEVRPNQAPQRGMRPVRDYDPAGGTGAVPPESGLFSRFKQLRRANFSSDEEVDAYVESLRDEWSDRER